MDKAEIKRQLSYWEAIQKENERSIKLMQDQNKQIKDTIKFLKSLVGKEPEPEQSTIEDYARDQGIQQ